MRQISKMSSISSAVVHRGLLSWATVLLVGAPSMASAQAGGELSVSGGATTGGGTAADADVSTTVESEPVPLTGAEGATDAAVPEAAEPENPPPSNEAPAYAGRRAEERYHAPTFAPFEGGYLSRYIPSGNQWEVSLFGGILFPSKNHNLKVAVLPVEEYSKVASQLGFRLGYYPLSFLGVEAQAFMGGGKLRDSDLSAVFYGMSGHLVAQLPLASLVPFLSVGVGTLGASSEVMGHDRDPAFVWGGGLKGALSHRVNLRLDFQDTLTQKRDAKNGTQTHHPAIQLGASFVFERHVERPEKIDSDYDGLFNEDDTCPNEGALTVDGCPEAPPVMDMDSDGVSDELDACPKEPGPAPDGCPNHDGDGDGVPSPTDQCPEQPGIPPTGCPDMDPDKDGIPGDKDQCPDQPESNNGYLDADGCPDEMPEEVRKFTGVIQGITFKQGTAEISPTSRPTLDDAAKILKDYPSIQIEVSGHTSSEGTEERNQQLSVERAEAVRKYFIDQGIEGERVLARGAGASEPIADNATKDGRAQNRRIEFRVLTER